jgi:hypothetical protein
VGTTIGTVAAGNDARFDPAVALGYDTEALSLNVTLTATSPRILEDDPNGADRTITLPQIGGAVNLGTEWRISHIGTANVLIIKSSVGVEQCRLSPGDQVTLTARIATDVWSVVLNPANTHFIRRKTSVSLLATGTTDIFTVPPNLSFVATAYSVLITAQSGASGSISFALEESGSSSSIAPSGLAGSIPATGKIFRVSNTGGTESMCAGGNTVRFRVNGAATGAQLDATVIIEGFYL